VIKINDFYNSFVSLLDSENKRDAVSYILSLLTEKKVNVQTLYSEILSPAMNNWVCPFDDENLCIWKEHVRTNIVNTVIESSYSFVVKEQEELNNSINKSVAVICPQEEYHDLGLKMVANIFILMGYKVTFVGANTPKEVIKIVIENFVFDYFAFSITDPYNIVETSKTINIIKSKNKDSKIIVGGYAFRNNSHLVKKIGADIIFNSFDDIVKFREGESL